MARVFPTNAGSHRVNVYGLVLPGAAFTVTAWIKPNGTFASGSNRIVTFTSTSFYITATGTVLQLDDSSWSGTAGVHFCTWSGSGVWRHVAVTQTGTAPATPKLYIDGASKSVTAGSTPTGTRATQVVSPTVIGNRSTGARGFSGSIAHVAVYGVVLSPGEIVGAMQRGYVTRGLLMYAPLTNGPLIDAELSRSLATFPAAAPKVDTGDPPVMCRSLGQLNGFL